MKHYTNAQMNVWAFESDGSQDDLITPDMAPISDADLFALRNPPPTPEQSRENAKAYRAAAVSAIQVTTQAGHIFDGDEVSQGRMARAVASLKECTERLAAGNQIVLPPDLAAIYRVVAGRYESVWVLSDNSAVYVGVGELSEALVLAGAAQAAVWVLP